MNIRRTFLALAAVAAAFATQIAGAQTSNSSGHASITIVPTLAITLVTNANWGTVVIPSTGTTNYSMNTSTGVVTATSGTGFSFGDSVAGNYLVSGATSEPISFSVSIGSFSGTGVSVVTPYINGTASSGTGTMSALGAFTLSIGGVLAVTSAATLGQQTATVTVTVSYS